MNPLMDSGGAGEAVVHDINSGISFKDARDACEQVDPPLCSD